MTTFALDGIEVLEQTDEKATAALVFLHGTGENGKYAKEKFVKFMKVSGHPYIKVYFPTAKERYLKIRDTVTTFWFNLIRVGTETGEVVVNLDDANEVADMIEETVSEIEKSDGIPRERIAVGGLSQGGMVSIYAAYVRGIKVGAVVGIAATTDLSGQENKILPRTTVPLLSLYGQKDAYIPPESMSKTWQLMRANKIPFQPKTLVNGEHFLSADYVKIMFEWLEKKIPPINEC